jgi:hypothetical protein
MREKKNLKEDGRRGFAVSSNELSGYELHFQVAGHGKVTTVRSRSAGGRAEFNHWEELEVSSQTTESIPMAASGGELHGTQGGVLTEKCS